MKLKTALTYVFILVFIGAAILVYQSDTAEGKPASVADCIQIEVGPVSSLSGLLVLESREDGQSSFVLDLATGERRELANLTANSIVGPSNAGLLTYYDYLNGAWMLVDLNGEVASPIVELGSITPIAWLDDVGLLIGGDRLQILDLASGETVNVISEAAFARMHEKINWSSSLSWQGYSPYRIVPGRDLKYLAYAANGEPGTLLVLWNQNTGQEVARLHWADTLTAPQWSPDGSSFVTSAPPFVYYEGHAFPNTSDDLPYVGGNELMQVGIDGSVRRLTKFTSIFKAGESQYRWSPDGTRIVFSLEFKSDDAELHRIAVLDVDSGHVSAFCLPPNENHLIGFPVWSPDERRLALTLSGANQVSHTYIVDVKSGKATGIEINVHAAGWWEE